MTAWDYLTDSELRANLTGLAATIKNRETREDAVQEAYADILALSPLNQADALKIGEKAIKKIEGRERRYQKKQVASDGFDLVSAHDAYSPSNYPFD